MSVQQTPEGGNDNKRLGAGAIATVGGAGALGVFMLQNTQDVTVEFLTWEFTWPVWFLVLVSAVFGAFVWIGAAIVRRRRRRKQRRADRRD